MSTYCPPVSNIPSISRRFKPLSMTCVSPSTLGLPGRGGRSRNPSKPLIELLQPRLRTGLNIVEQGIAVGVDADRERPEVLDAELPQALRHQLLPVDLLDLLDLRGLERGRAADDREVDHSVSAHRLDRVIGQAALAADRADAMVAAERLGEAHHPCRRRRPDADLLIATFPDLADTGRRVE